MWKTSPWRLMLVAPYPVASTIVCMLTVNRAMNNMCSLLMVLSLDL